LISVDANYSLYEFILLILKYIMSSSKARSLVLQTSEGGLEGGHEIEEKNIEEIRFMIECKNFI